MKETETIRLLIICHEYPPARHGGIGSLVQTIARQMVKQGHHVSVLGLTHQDEMPRQEDDNGVLVERIMRGKPRFLSWLKDRKKVYKRAQEIIKERNINIVEFDDYGGSNALWAKQSIPVIIRLNGSQVYFAKELDRKMNKLMAWLENKSFKKADFICSASDYTARKTQKAFNIPFKYEVIYNPVDVIPESTAEKDPNLVIFSGTLTSKKGIIQLVKAWDAVTKQLPDAKLHIYGKDGRTDDTNTSMTEYLKSIVKENDTKGIDFKGVVAKEFLLERLKEASIAVYPSYAEAFAVAPLEAMACGCATIYSTRGSGNELISEGENGYLIDPDDIPSISQRIIDLLGNPELRTKIAKAGKQHVDNTFTIPIIVEKNIAFYKNCISSFK